MSCPKPGVYEGVDFDEYRSWAAVNNSSLGPMRHSPAHYHAALQSVREETPALRFGTLCHAAKLEPLIVLERYTVMPDLTDGLRKDDGTEYSNPRASKAYKERVAAWRQANANKQEISQAEFDDLIGISRALDDDARAHEWLRADGSAEVSIVWRDPATGLMCKGRIDKLLQASRMAVDLKTTRDGSDFERSMAKFGYARQAAFYADGLRELTGHPHWFAFVAVESSAPWAVRSALVAESALTAGRIEYRTALQAIAAGRKTHRWPGYEQPEQWDLPAWAQPDCELIVDGQFVNL